VGIYMHQFLPMEETLPHNAQAMSVLCSFAHGPELSACNSAIPRRQESSILKAFLDSHFGRRGKKVDFSAISKRKGKLV